MIAVAGRDNPIVALQRFILYVLTIFGIICVATFWSTGREDVFAIGYSDAIVPLFIFALAHLIPLIAFVTSIIFLLMRRGRAFFYAGNAIITLLVLVPIYAVGSLNGLFG